ncbi:hypothetical protein SynMVIR181_03031 [Synechococcus sp. MVIR-18-1]|nr:hypothetical protein SynMVIR181_03031 [Synechococcus sp. MVIR-18-1]
MRWPVFLEHRTNGYWGYPKTGVPLPQVLFVTDSWIVPLTQAWLLPFGRIDHLLLDLRVDYRDSALQ